MVYMLLKKQWLTPREVRLGLRDGSFVLSDRWPDPPADWSEFQRNRVLGALDVAYLYLREGMKMSQIAQLRNVKHQRITQILTLAVNFLRSQGALIAAAPGWLPVFVCRLFVPKVSDCSGVLSFLPLQIRAPPSVVSL